MLLKAPRFAGIVFVVCASAAPGVSAQQTTVDLIGKVRQSQISAVGLSSLVARSGHLYFLALRNSTNFFGATLVSSTLDGEVEWFSSLGPDEVSCLSGDDTGVSTLTSYPLQGPGRVRSFGRDGKLRREERMKTVDGQTFMPSAEVHDSELFEMAGGKAATVNLQVASASIVDKYTGLIETRSFDDLEVSRVRSLNALEESAQPGLRMRTLNVCGGDGNDLYCMVSGFKPSEGALVLKMDSSGKTVGSFRVAIPYADGHPTIPVSVSVDRGGVLYLLNDLGTVSAYAGHSVAQK